MSRRTALSLYALLVLIWSSTWVAIKIGLEDSPALLGAGIRFTVGGALLLAVSAASEDWGDAVWGAKAIGSILYLALAVAGLLAARGRPPAALRRRAAARRHREAAEQSIA
jgi:drug/metabolite transporter (DMT)-like permease